MCKVENFSGLRMDQDHRNMLEAELNDWHLKYPRGETFCDIGAGNGETAQFAFNHGAKRVIAIEPDAGLLIKNFPDAIVVPSDARMVIIPWAIDAMKIDGEGCERNLVLETHFPFRMKFLGNSAIVTPLTNLWKIGPDTGLSELFMLRLLRVQLAHAIRKSFQIVFGAVHDI